MFKKIMQRIIKIMWVIIASGIIMFAVAVSIIKLTLPYVNNYKADIEQYLLTNFDAQISIGNIDASWKTSGPVLIVHDLSITPTATTPLDMAIYETQIEVDFWQSLIEQRFVNGVFLLNGVDAKINSDVFYKVKPNSNGGQLFESLSHLFLSQLQSFKIINSQVKVRHKQGQTQEYQIDTLRWINSGNRHQASGEVFVDGFSNNSASIIVDLYGQRRQDIFGQVYLEASKMDISPWLDQLINEHVSLESTEASFKIWGDVKDGLVGNIIVDVEESGIRWQKESQQQYLGIRSAQLQWRKSKQGWSLFSNNIALNNGLDEYQGFQFVTASDENNIRVDVIDGDLQPLSRLFSLFSVTKGLGILAESNITGDINFVKLQLDAENQLQAAANVSNLSLIPLKEKESAHWGFEGANLSASWVNNEGWFELTDTAGTFVTDDTFSQSFDYADFEVMAHVRASENGVTVNVPKILIENDDLSVNVAAQYTNFDKPNLSLYGEIKGPKSGTIKHYLPKYLIPLATYNYLNEAIEKGFGEFTQIAISGDPGKMPYSDLTNSSQYGTFVLKALLKQAQFKFDETWPAINNMDAQLLVEDSLLTIKADSGEFAGIQIKSDVEASIGLDAVSPSLQLLITPEHLELEKFHNLIDVTPLKPILGDIFEFVRLDGGSTAAVNISIPLSSDPDLNGNTPKVMVSGNVITNNAGIKLPQLGLDFNNVNSLVTFENSTFSVKSSSAELFKLPVNLDVTGSEKNTGYGINAQLIADWNVDNIEKQHQLKVMKYIDGAPFTQLDVDVNIEQDGFQYFVNANSDLSNTSYDVTGSLKKQLGVASNLNYSMLGDQDGSELQVNLDNKLFFEGKIVSESGRMEQAHLSIGENVTQLPESGFDISIEENALEFEPTLAFVLDLIDDLPAGDSKQPGFIDQPHHIFGSIQNLSILGQDWQNVSLDAKPSDDSWLFSIGAKQALADVVVHNDIKKDGIDITASFLRLGTELMTVPENPEADNDKAENNKPEDENVESTTLAGVKPSMDNSAQLISTLVPIKFDCASCFYNGMPLGQISLSAYPQDNELIIDKAKLNYKNNQIDLTGRWVGDDGAGSTYVKGNAKSKELGKWMKEYGFTTGIEESNASINIDVNWQSAPQWIDLESLNGKVNFKLGEGYFSEIDVNGLRWISMFSFDSLYRKLKLDFKDVFSTGFFYNDIKGSVTLVNGVGYSDNIKMDGIAGDMSMVGHTDLNMRTLDYDVAFKPKITSNYPIIVWLTAINPATFLGVMALDKVIENADLFEFLFKVSGELKKPTVKEVKRFDKREKIPEPILDSNVQTESKEHSNSKELAEPKKQDSEGK